jgi:hypothetical protein
MDLSPQRSGAFASRRKLSAATGTYVIRVVRPDGREQFETFPGDGALRLRLAELESQLREQN